MKFSTKSFAFRQRFSSAKTAQEEKRLAKKQELEFALQHPENEKPYRNALRTLAIRQTSINIKSFAKWLIIDLLWIAPPYVAYGWYQIVLNNTLASNSVTSRMLWGVQEQLQLGAIIVGALIIISGLQIVKQGWYHKPYKRGSLAKEMRHSLDSHGHVKKAQHAK